jgi:hypothetical protein
MSFEPINAAVLFRGLLGGRQYANGGGVGEEGTDLFENYDNIHANVQAIKDKYSDGFEDGDYAALKKAQKEMNKIGYNFEYGLDGVAYDLRPVGSKGKAGDDEYGKGGPATFDDKVKAISSRLEGTKVKPKYQKQYGKRYSKGEAKEAATKIAGKMTARERAKAILAKRKKK